MVMWGFTLGEAKPFLEHKKRDWMFRELVIGFFTGGKEDDNKASPDNFCKACKAAKLDKNCDTCSKTFEVIDPTDERLNKNG
jgi:hypothetical protein